MDAADHLEDLAEFVGRSPSSYHAAAEVAARLVARGWTLLDEAADWTSPIRPGARIVVVRDGAVVAVAVPEGAGSTTAFRILGAHTDSPGLKVKPDPVLSSAGLQQVAVEVYGGPILASWFDRELELAGRVVDLEGAVRLVRTGPIARVPHLAVHLGRDVNGGFAPDRQRDLQPLLSTVHDARAVIERAAGLPGRIAGFDLITCDTQPPRAFGDLFASPRLDNLTSVHAGLTAVESLEPGGAIAVLAAFDHEEVGSETRSGAAGPLLADVLERVNLALGGDREAFARACAASWCLSADAGHAVHPNRGEKHDPVVRPVLGGGPLLKVNAVQRYTTDAVGTALWSRVCAAADVPWQPFVSNNAVPCGSTIGPITATRLGIRTLDVGTPLLSMHSARELCHVEDPARLAAAAGVFLTAAE